MSNSHRAVALYCNKLAEQCKKRTAAAAAKKAEIARERGSLHAVG
ncbi:hypothetical protein AB0F05_33420 [Streptomyces microflavus]|nr:hypothetical protein [Streptomyces sp. CA-256286]QTA36930.1 hypothetical protein JHY03_71460 [Streptomyces sp. CA-256286]